MVRGPSFEEGFYVSEVLLMATGVDTRLVDVARAAKSRVATDLVSSQGQPVIDYCRELVDWVVSGKNKPTGAPTDRVRAAVGAAVNVGLTLVYGGVNASGVDPSIRTRRDAL